MTRASGAYIPPGKLSMMQAKITDKSNVEFQKLAWEALRKTIHGLLNRINISNIHDIVILLIKENIIRGKGLFASSVIQAQAASPTFTCVYAALVAIINSKVICF
jgi:pre-mRNA-splicing factor CWC22